MAFIPVPNTLQLELRGTLDGQEVENVLHFSKAGTPTTGDAAALASAVDAWWRAGIRTLQSNQFTMREYYVTDQSAADGFVYSMAPAGSAVGADGAVAVPNAIAACVTFRTAARGRTGRGRNYVAGIASQHFASNSFTTALLNALVGEYLELVALASGVGLTWVVVSRYVNKAPRTTGVARPVIATSWVSDVGKSQRRRRPGAGV